MEHRNKEEGLEERVELSLLYDFYGALLKENQKRMFEACILEDYNFSEIAQEEGISRQGVYDAIKRASRQLRSYEEKLGLVARFEKQNALLQRIRSEVKLLEPKKDNLHWDNLLLMLEEIVTE